MGLLDILLRMFFPRIRPHSPAPTAGRTGGRRRPKTRRGRRPQLVPLRYAEKQPIRSEPVEVPGPQPPYRFAHLSIRPDHYLDMSRDGDDATLHAFGLPVFQTPDQLAGWLGMPPGRLAWLVHRYKDNQRPQSEQQAHYHFVWKRKRLSGWRLIEAPKQTLRSVQQRIRTEILDRVSPHPAAHGFVSGRSIVSNARPHSGRDVVVKLDLDNFYASVRFARVVSIFRTLGYSREAAIWLARLVTSAIPTSFRFPDGDHRALQPFLPRHLPQGAPTSPALANLSAYGLDVRLQGLARSFDGVYTRYGDDLTFSGDARFARGLRVFLPLVSQVIRSERFRLNVSKRRVLRPYQSQSVTGVVVNERPNVRRAKFDELKAILHNCLRHGPSTQNRDQHENFAAHLHGRIAHIYQLNPARGERLLQMWQQIDWNR